jgi:hypothetical protein
MFLIRNVLLVYYIIESLHFSLFGVHVFILFLLIFYYCHAYVLLFHSFGYV